MNDDYNKGYFDGGDVRNREQERGRVDRIQEQIAKERAIAQRSQEQAAESARRVNEQLMTTNYFPTRHPGSSTATDGTTASPAPGTPLKTVVSRTALSIMAFTGLWCYFIGHYPLGFELVKMLIVGYIGGAAAGLGFWLIGWMMRVVMSILSMMMTVAFWGVLVWVGYYVLVHR